jgi:copper homeostasis protein (lipoprotein)
MNKTARLIVLVALVPGFFLCKSQNKSARGFMATDFYNSRNSIEWQGSYLGVLPCADCPGIQKTIYLYRDGGYRIRIQYMGKEVRATELSGKIDWADDGNSITLTELNGLEQSYLVGENRLIQLDGNGSRITGALATRYILSKDRYAILEKYWKLTELNGKLVVTDTSTQMEPHIIFKEDGNKFTGNGGCNKFSGTFEFGDLDRISLSKATSTRIACPNIGWEMEFLKALAEVDNYSITSDRLVLKRGPSVPLAKFEAVHMK